MLGTVMGVVRDGPWIFHDVEATGPDGRRISLRVVSKHRHTGPVRVRWDPSGSLEPRFVSERPWALYAVVVLLVVAIAVGAWVVLT